MAAPVSGFHHAGYAAGAGFCTFNGLMVTAMALKADASVQRVGILDLDVHYGNGTSQIMSRLHTSWIQHYTSGQHDLPAHAAERFLNELPSLVGEFRDCDVLLYQVRMRTWPTR